MSPKKIEKKRNQGLKSLQSFVSKDLNLKKFKVNPTNVIENTKSKIGNFYSNLKKEREKEKRRLENKRIIDEKKELERQKKQAQKDSFNALDVVLSAVLVLLVIGILCYFTG